ncbi:hypothetical protein Aperf_G00000105163 [Anoplocephala perfoliata]
MIEFQQQLAELFEVFDCIISGDFGFKLDPSLQIRQIRKSSVTSPPRSNMQLDPKTPSTRKTPRVPKVITPWSEIAALRFKKGNRFRGSKSAQRRNTKIPTTPNSVMRMSRKEREARVSLRNSKFRTHSYGSLPPAPKDTNLRIPPLSFDEDPGGDFNPGEGVQSTPVKDDSVAVLRGEHLGTPVSPSTSNLVYKLKVKYLCVENGNEHLRSLQPLAPLQTPTQSSASDIPRIVTPWSSLIAKRVGGIYLNAHKERRQKSDAQ